MFKKIVIVGTIFILIVVGAVAVFILTFDADRYRPQLVKQLETALGSPVRIGHLALGWKNGIVFEAKEVAVYRDKQSLAKPAVYLALASAKVRLAPLLHKKLEVASITLVRPQLNVIKEAGGMVRINGINPSPSSGRTPTSLKTTPAFLSDFTISTIRIEDAGIGFLDNSSSPPIRLAIRHSDILITNLSFSKPTDFEAKLALFNASQNFQLKGRLRVSSPTGPYLLEGFRLDTDLATIKIQELIDSIPQAKRAGLQDLSGSMTGKINRLKIDSGHLTGLDSDFDLKRGRIAVESLRSALDHADLSAHFTESQMQLKNFTANFARGKLSGSGTSKNYLSAPQSTLALEIDRIYLEDLLPPRRPSQPELHGIFSASFNGDARGVSWPAISQTLNGSGKVALANGVIVNGNILRKVFEHLSKIPGVADAINTRLPEKHRRNLAERDTAIPSIEFPVTITNGIITIPNLQIFFEGFTLYGSGQVGLSGTIKSEATLVLDAELSQILIQNVPTMQYIADSQGNLAFPVRISGTTQNLLVLPDTDYIFSRVMATKGQELITNVLQKALNKNQGATAEGGAGNAQEQLLKNLFGQTGS